MKYQRWLCAAVLPLALTLGTTAQADTRVAIGTGGTGGVFYIVGAGMANLISKKVPGVTANAEVTGASIENVRRVSAGEMVLGFSSASTLYAASKGEAPFKTPMNVSAVAYLYPAVLQVAAMPNVKAQTVADLGNARVSIGPPGSNSAVLGMRLLKAAGSFNARNIQHLSYTEATNAMKNGNLDASMVLAGVPTGAFIELTNSTSANLVAVTEAQAQALIKDYPYYQAVSIRGAAYKNHPQATMAIGDPAVLFTSKNANPDLVFKLTQALFDNLGDVAAIHPAAKAISKATATRTPIALHPGAARYFNAK